MKLDKVYFDSATNIKFCFLCQSLKYPRFNHCRYCNKCIYKLDHHCFFINNCVGQHNQRFFVQFLFYLWVPCLVSSLFHLYSLVADSLYFKKHPEFRSPYLPGHLLRLPILCHFVFNCCMFLIVCGLFCFQMYLIKVNLTSIEFFNQYYRRHLPFERPWKEAFEGKRSNCRDFRKCERLQNPPASWPAPQNPPNESQART